MSGKKIIFKRAVALHTENILDELVDSMFAESFSKEDLLSEKLEAWRKLGISSLVIFDDAAENAELDSGVRRKKELLLERIRELPFDVTFLNLPELNRENFSDFEELDRTLLELMKTGDGLYLFSGSHTSRVQFLIASLLLYMRRKSVTPEKIIAQIYERNHLLPEDRILFYYLNFINSDYQIPTEIANASTGEETRPQLSPEELLTLPDETIVRDELEAAQASAINFPLIPPEREENSGDNFGARRISEAKSDSSESENSVDMSNLPEERWTIRTRYTTAAVIITTLALVSSFIFTDINYRNDLRRQLLKHSATQTLLVAKKFETDIQQLGSSVTRFMKEKIDQKNIAENRKKSRIAEFFSNHSRLIYIARLQSRNNNSGFNVREKYFNEEYFKSNLQSYSDITALNQRYLAKLARYDGHKQNLLNVSPDFGRPLFGLALHERDGEKKVNTTVVYFEPGEMLELLNQSETGNTFIINRQSEVIAHPDPLLVVGRSLISNTALSEFTSPGNESSDGVKVYQSRDMLGHFRQLSFAGLGVATLIDFDAHLNQINEVRFFNARVLLAVLLLTFLTFFLIIRRVSNSLRELTVAAQKIGSENYDVGLKVSGNDETAVLTTAILNMARSLDRNQRSRITYGKVINPSMMENAMFETPRSDGENRYCSVLIVNLHNLATLSTSKPAVQIVEIVNRYFAEMEKCVNKHLGIFDKIMGDSLMAHWGVMLRSSNEAQNAVNCALDMREALLKLNNRLNLTGQPTLAMTAGIHCGSTTVGRIGTTINSEFSIIGETVKTARQISEIGYDYGVDLVISSAVREMCGSNINNAELQAPDRSGNLVKYYACLGRANAGNPIRNLEDLRKYLSHFMPDAKEEVKK